MKKRYLNEKSNKSVSYNNSYNFSNNCHNRHFYLDKAKKTVKKLLKNNLVDFLGSDCHKPNQIYLLVPKAIKKIKKIIGDSRFEKISTLNPQKILKNEEWEYDEKN